MQTLEWHQHEQAGGRVPDFLELDRAHTAVRSGRATPEQRMFVAMASDAHLLAAQNYARTVRADERQAQQEIKLYGSWAREWYATVRPTLNIAVHASAATPRQREHRDRTARSSARSGDSGDDGPPSPEAHLLKAIMEVGIPVSEAGTIVNTARASLRSETETLPIAVARVILERAEALRVVTDAMVAEYLDAAQEVTR